MNDIDLLISKQLPPSSIRPLLAQHNDSKWAIELLRAALGKDELHFEIFSEFVKWKSWFDQAKPDNFVGCTLNVGAIILDNFKTILANAVRSKKINEFRALMSMNSSIDLTI